MSQNPSNGSVEDSMLLLALAAEIMEDRTVSPRKPTKRNTAKSKKRKMDSNGSLNGSDLSPAVDLKERPAG